MKFNGTIFSKPQQDQLKENIGNELEKASAKIDEVDARMLNYKGDWVSGDEYHENDLVTWTDGNLYEVIKAHTSSSLINPDNAEYYKAMTKNRIIGKSFTNLSQLYNFITGLDYGRIGSLQVKEGSSFLQLNPQENTRNFSSTIILNSDGKIRHTMLSLTPNSVTAFYLDVGIDGTRTKTNFTPENYVVYYFK